jgi:hypothetical protein
MMVRGIPGYRLFLLWNIRRCVVVFGYRSHEKEPSYPSYRVKQPILLGLFTAEDEDGSLFRKIL